MATIKELQIGNGFTIHRDTGNNVVIGWQSADGTQNAKVPLTEEHWQKVLATIGT